MSNIKLLFRYVKRGFVNIPHSLIITCIREDYEGTINVLSQIIRKLRYPYKRYCISPYDLIQSKSTAYIDEMSYIKNLFEYQASETRMYEGKEIAIIYTREDSEKLDTLTDYFTEYARVRSRLKKSELLIRAWKGYSTVIAKKCVEVCIAKEKDFDMRTLSEGITNSSLKACSNFKISIVITVLNHFKSKVYFDPFAGWGDRALGSFLSDTVTTYIGTDPNSLLVKGYREIEEFCSDNGKNIRLYNLPIEDLELPDIRPDIIFTSPPFYDYEIYNNENTQSIVKYPDLGSWTNDWFIPTTLRLFEYLLPGGKFIYHLNDVTLNLVNRLIDELSNMAEFKGQIGIMRNRSSRSKTFLYVWEKY